MGIIKADLMPEEAGEINLSELMKQEVDAKDVGRGAGAQQRHIWWRKIKKALTPICQVTERSCMKIIERF